MKDKVSLEELLEIFTGYTKQYDLKMTATALPYIKEHIGTDYNAFYHRGLLACQMLVDLHLPYPNEMLDILTAVAITHAPPLDRVPDDHEETMAKLFAGEPKVAEILSVLRRTDYNDKDYFKRLMLNRYALVVRLAERGVLVETLFEWPTSDARRFITETKESFFPMCIYAKEHYLELIGPASILMEKTRNLVSAAEAMLNRYDFAEESLRREILSFHEENAVLRAMINEIKATKARLAKMQTQE